MPPPPDRSPADLTPCIVTYAVPIPRPYTGSVADQLRETSYDEGPPWAIAPTGRIHRIRLITRSALHGHLMIDQWCGTHPTRAQVVDRIDPTASVCGTCEGRAVGAGQPSTPELLARPHAYAPLVFTPRGHQPPAVCPGSHSRLGDPTGRVCWVCGDRVPFRGVGGPWRPDYVLQRHPPGPGLVAPCHWHAWLSLVALQPGRVRCACSPVPLQRQRRRV